MTPQTALELKFADGDYLFDLKLPQLAELQEKRGCGIFKLYGRVIKGRFLVGEESIALPEEGEAFAEDIFEVIRLGLIGGGKGVVDGREVAVSALRARQLVESYCHNAPLREPWAVAAAVLAARVEGFTPPEDKKKASPVGSSGQRKRRSTSPRPQPTAR
jgi:hypothetical protein